MRIGTLSLFSRVLFGLRRNGSDLVRAQEQLASGLRILRPSDDPAGASRTIQIERRLADLQRFRGSANAGRATVDAGASALQDGSTLLADARELVLQGMNGTLSDDDRRSLAEEIELLRTQMLELGNQRIAGHYLFGGTETDRAPWREVTSGGRTRVVYQGNEEAGVVRAGEGVLVQTTPPGSEIFGRSTPGGASFAGLTGAASGTTADEGEGWVTLAFRHDATDPGTLASVGVALANGGADDTLLGSNTLEIDPVAGTLRLGNGTAVPLQASADVVVRNELGGELHLDLTGYTGASFSGAVVGAGSVSLDGTTFVPLTFAETDLELSDPANGTLLHVDTTGVKRAGNELVTFTGATNVFDVLDGIARDLRNPDGLDSTELAARLGERLGELDRHHEDLRVGLGVLGARSQRLQVSDARAADVQLQLESVRSDVRDADFAAVALDLAQADHLLQVTQASGARLIQTSLLNFLQ